MAEALFEAAELHRVFAEEYRCDLTQPDWEPVWSNCADYRNMVALWFKAGKNEPDAPLVRAAYAAFEAELYAQFCYLISNGVKFDFTWDDPVDPETGKPSYKYTKRCYEETGALKVFRTHWGEHPILARVANGCYHYDGLEINANDLFRAVHDYLGHLASGGNFGERGEKIAYLSHYKLFGPLARRALYTETVAQNAVYNSTREFAEQKVMLFPVEYHAVPM